MKIILGIGNPGRDYDHTRHNVGFDTVDCLARQHALDAAFRERFSALVAVGTITQERVALLKPQTYVNLSGQSARAALDWYQEPPESLLVICDDFHLDLGRLRVRPGGSSGGHKGLQSIAEALGTEDYPRLRIGIGQPKPDAAVDHVLSRFDAHERDVVEDAVARACDAACCWVTEDIEACMAKFNAA